MGAFEYRQAEEIRDAFERHGVRYLFVGKSGAILLGFPDTTQDADLFVAKSPANGRAIVAALRAIGFALGPEQGAGTVDTKERMTAMRTRRLGRTGLQVSEIGYGAWGIGGGLWVGAQDDESLRALHRAADLGLNFIDTALAYGPHKSERLVGRFVRERKERIYVATKIPPKNLAWPAGPGVPVSEVFPAPYIAECVEKSLRNLATETIDLVQLHVWRDEWLEHDGWRDAFLGLKQSGKARFLGVSVNDHDPGSALRVVGSGLIDCVQVIYNIFDQSPADALFPACVQHDVGVIVRVPLDEGGLTGAIRPDSTFPEGDFRARYFRGERRAQVVARAEALAALLGEEAQTLPELALRFCLSHDAVSTVIPGMRRVATAEANCAVSDGRRLSPGLLEQLQAHAWRRNFYD